MDPDSVGCGGAQPTIFAALAHSGLTANLLTVLDDFRPWLIRSLEAQSDAVLAKADRHPVSSRRPRVPPRPDRSMRLTCRGSSDQLLLANGAPMRGRADQGRRRSGMLTARRRKTALVRPIVRKPRPGPCVPHDRGGQQHIHGSQQQNAQAPRIVTRTNTVYNAPRTMFTHRFRAGRRARERKIIVLGMAMEIVVPSSRLVCVTAPNGTIVPASILCNLPG
jgi:hypothetical protein